MEQGQQVFAKDSMGDAAEVWPWPEYRKKVTTRAVKIDGPFMVETSEGPLTCADGYLAVDARGYPYPIATDEFELIYEPVDGDVARHDVGRDVHPATAGVLGFFGYGHLPPALAEVSRPFCDLAYELAGSLEGPELTVALRKLLEAKDCAVRAKLEAVAGRPVSHLVPAELGPDAEHVPATREGYMPPEQLGGEG